MCFQWYNDHTIIVSPLPRVDIYETQLPQFQKSGLSSLLGEVMAVVLKLQLLPMLESKKDFFCNIIGSLSDQALQNNNNCTSHFILFE